MTVVYAQEGAAHNALEAFVLPRKDKEDVKPDHHGRKGGDAERAEGNTMEEM